MDESLETGVGTGKGTQLGWLEEEDIRGKNLENETPDWHSINSSSQIENTQCNRTRDRENW